MKKIDRRSFVQRGGLAGLSLLAFSLGSRRSMADPDPPADAQKPASTAAARSEADIYSFQLGGAEAFVINDGAVSMPGIQPIWAPEAEKSELEALLRKDFLPTDHVALCLNVLVIKTKSGVVLFDGGAGSAFGPVAGKLLRGLDRIGITPKEVRAICLTHAHMDHIGGLLDDSHRPIFGEAKILAARNEVEFWTAEHPDLSGMRTPLEATAQMSRAIKSSLDALKDRLELKPPGRLLPEVELIPAMGHTPGHSLFQVTIGSEKLLVIGDAVHLHALQFPHPEWTMAYDVNPAQAVQTRRKLFAQTASDRSTVLGYHMPFPGIGHVRAAGNGYEWVPRPWAV